MNEMLSTNPNIRCLRCGGRLVIEKTETGDVITNLTKQGEYYFCKDIEECNQNVEAESNFLDIVMDEGSIGFYDRKKGEELIWVGVKNV